MDFSLKISSWNANGVSNKKSSLINYLHDRQIDVMLINETKLKANDKLKIRGYTVLRKDRPNALRGGGVAIVISNNVPYELIKTPCISSIEYLTIKLSDGTILTSVYNNPRNIYNRSDLDNLLNVGHKVLLIEDLNARHTTWNNRINNRNGNTLFDLTQTEPVIVYHTEDPTHFPTNGSQPTTIDLVINKNVQDIKKPIYSFGPRL